MLYPTSDIFPDFLADEFGIFGLFFVVYYIVFIQ